MKILCGAPVRQQPDILAAHLRTILWQETDAQVDYLYINDLDPDDETYEAATDVLFGHKELEVVSTDIHARPSGSEYVAGDDTHHWNVPTFHWLATLRQRILDQAVERGYDAVFMVDTDLLLGPKTLQSLIDTGKDIVSGVFWTRWDTSSPPLPQVWLKHPYGLAGRGLEQHEFLQKLASRQLTKVFGLGACTLMRTSVLDKVAYSPLLDGLPSGGMWEGEDRSFCIRAERAHVELWADAWPDIWHCYRPGYAKDIERRLDYLSREDVVRRPSFGDLISFTLEPLSEPGLAGHKQSVRGRLGAIPIADELEEYLSSASVGESALITVTFPVWSEIKEYRGTERVIRVTLLDVKPYSLPLSLENRPPCHHQWALTPPEIQAIKRSSPLAVQSA
jgi:hypothetical protein